MVFNRVQQSDINSTILFCYSNEPEMRLFSRNAEKPLEERVLREANWVKSASESLKFYDLYIDNDFAGYFGTENHPIQCLTTFFIMPKYRQFKNEIWDYMTSDFTGNYVAGVFKVNTRAAKFFEKQGGKFLNEFISEENHPSVVYLFTR
jgi:hypothetical protein